MNKIREVYRQKGPVPDTNLITWGVNWSSQSCITKEEEENATADVVKQHQGHAWCMFLEGIGVRSLMRELDSLETALRYDDRPAALGKMAVIRTILDDIYRAEEENIQ